MAASINRGVEGADPPHSASSLIGEVALVYLSCKCISVVGYLGPCTCISRNCDLAGGSFERILFEAPER